MEHVSIPSAPTVTKLLKASSYSTCIAAAVMGAPQRGIIHSAFDAAANIVFPGDFVLSLNAASFSHVADTSAVGGIGTINRPLRDSEGEQPIPRMPNGLQLTAAPGTFPFTALRVGMPVLFGAQRLHIEAIGCSLDLSLCSQWNPHIERPAVVDMEIVRKNRERLGKYVEGDSRVPTPPLHYPRPYYDTRGVGSGIVGAGVERSGVGGLVPARREDHSFAFPSIHDMAQFLCGRGIGLTPTGDDMLAGWMAAGWLLYGPMPSFLDACQQIVEVAKRQTHLLSQCWLGYAAEGNVAQPICVLLDALTCDDAEQLSVAAEAVLTMGATSGYDVIQGMLLMLNEM